MKKLLSITAMVGVSLFLSNAAFATTGASSAAGAQVTIADATPSPAGPGLTISVSPGVGLSWQTTMNAYAITSVNSSAADGVRNEYGIWSGYSGYYQAPDADSTDPVGDLTAPGDPSGTSDPTAFANFTKVGGS